MATVSDHPPVPTIDDIASKTCFICLSNSGSGEDTSTRPDPAKDDWVHPCKCALIAHQSCLLRYLARLQKNSLLTKAVKCPQCQTQYKLEYKPSAYLSGLYKFHKATDAVAKSLTVAAGLGLTFVGSTGLLAGATAYGAWSVKLFFGEQVYRDILGFSPTNWPYSAWTSLPFIIPRLLFMRTVFSAPIPVVLPNFLAFPTPVGQVDDITELQGLNERLVKTEPQADSPFPEGLGFAHAWPPSPNLFFFFLYPLVRIEYGRLHSFLKFKILGPSPKKKRRNRRQRNRDNANGERRDRGFFRRLLEDTDDEADFPADPERQQAEQEEDINNVDFDALPDEPVSFIYRALHFVASSLLIPHISNIMGSLLLRSVGSWELGRALLGVRSSAFPGRPVFLSKADGAKAGFLAPLRGTFKEHGFWPAFDHFWLVYATGNAYWRGLKDVVWWRNLVGLGVFCVTKDMLTLAYQYYKQRELKSRRVKSWDFTDAKLDEEDLIPR